MLRNVKIDDPLLVILKPLGHWFILLFWQFKMFLGCDGALDKKFVSPNTMKKVDIM